MRWFLASVAALCVLAVIYFGSCLFALSGLVKDVQAGDGAAVIGRTDVPRLNRSLTEQVIQAYLQRIGATRRVSTMERLVANTYGATIADAMIAKILTADRLTGLLMSGQLGGGDQVPLIQGFPALGNLSAGSALNLLGRIGFVQPVTLSFQITDTVDKDAKAALVMHFQGSGWKLAGIDLPPGIVRQLAAALPDR